MFEFERATSVPALWNAWQKVNGNNSKNSGIDQMDLDFYRSNAKENINILHYSLISDSYEPYREKSFISRKNRRIYISCLEDKIVQSAIAKVIYETASINRAVHGFIKNRSIFTAHTALKKSLHNHTTNYFKADISRFYESIRVREILRQIAVLINDFRFVSLVEKLVLSHSPGLSTGSALSPVLSNVYLSDFDENRQLSTGFYSRYVDDMLLAPSSEKSMDTVITDTSEELAKIGLCLNMDKSQIVNYEKGFTYLGFDIKAKNKLVDDLILQGDFASADKFMNISDEATETEQKNPEETEIDEKTVDEKQLDYDDGLSKSTIIVQEENESTDDEDFPDHILAVSKKCHMVRQFVNKARLEKYLSFPEKQTLLHIFHSLGEDGQKYIHWVLSHCSDYNCAVTQGYIDRCRTLNPIGCKKLCERFEDICDKSKCKCNFSNDKFYPSPVVHALRRKSGCVKLPRKEDSIGHFKQLSPKQGVEETLSRMMDLNKKEYEIKAQQKICNGQLESLFTRNEITEIQTPQGLLIKNDDGFFIKVG